MSLLNNTNIEVLRLLLIGIPGLEKRHIWISIPFSSVYLLPLLGNFIVLFFIKTAKSPWTHELFPFHALHLWPRVVPLFLTHHFGTIPIRCPWNSCSCMLRPEVLYPFIHSHWSFCAICNGIQPMCGHLQPSEIQYNLNQLPSHQNRGLIDF